MAGSAGKVTDGMQTEAQRGLDWRAEYGRGGTSVGANTARRILADDVSLQLAVKMRAYFARHEVDQQGEGWNRDEPGYPSAGRIAWALWGGDAGRSWSERVVAAAEREGRRSAGTGPSMRHQLHVKASYGVETATDAPHGEVTALVSVFNNVDLAGDRIVPGAFAKSLARIAQNGKALPFVWSHQWNDPHAYIGKVVEARETAQGLEVRAALFDTPTAQHIKTLLAEGVVTEFSFAFDILDSRKGKDGVIELLELNILEAGPTLKGANPATQLVDVRSALSLDAKAEPGELVEGDFVEWSDGYGRVEYIMTDGEFGVDGDPLSLQASAENPLALVRLYEDTGAGFEPTEMFQGFPFSELVAVDAAPQDGTASTATDSKSEEPAEANGERSVETETHADPTGDALIQLLELETLDL
jgi:HK97 family phage prohead protease